MSKSKKPWYKNEWVIGITCAMLPMTWTWVAAKRIDETLLSMLARTVPVPVWLLVILPPLLYTTWRLWKRLKKPKYTNPHRSDILKQWRWSWDWVKKPNGSWALVNLKPHCPQCDTIMEYENAHWGRLAVFPKCDRRYSTGNEGFESKSVIEALIASKVSRGGYPELN